MARKKKAIKIEVKEGAEKVPVQIIRHTSVKKAVITLYTEMTKKEVKEAYRQVKKCWRAEKRQLFHEKVSEKYLNKLNNLLKGE